MPTIDLSTPPTAATDLLERLPRRAALTLPELRLVADRAGGAPLPFEPAGSAGAGRGSALEDRLGTGRASAEDAAYAATLAGLHDPATSLARRGLLGPDSADEGVLGAVGLLATPTTAVDIDVTAGGVQARSWHRQSGDAVATLSTVDGAVFELAWFETAQWVGELCRAGVLPGDLTLGDSEVPGHVDLPFELADSAAEAGHSGRPDLVPVLAAHHTGSVVDADGSPLSDAQVATVLGALQRETRGRLRVLVADVSAGETSMIGVVSWTLLADGWHALRTRYVDGVHRVVVRKVDAADLPVELAPVLAEVRA